MYCLRTMPTLMTSAQLGKETLPVTREGDVVYVDGKPIRRGGTQFTVRAMVSPLSGKDLLIVPEGERFNEQFWLFQPLIDVEIPLQTDDTVLREKRAYQVQDVKAWGNYVQARISRIDVGPEADSEQQEDNNAP